jgi:hypothetical protein
MERTDALGPDVAENWHTNVGIITYGTDASGAPLAATSGIGNSQAIELLTTFASVPPVPVQVGVPVSVSLDLSTSARREFGWPWIQATRLQDGGVAGGGGAVADSLSGYSFSTSTIDGAVQLTIDTAGLAPGEHFIWVVYGQGKVILIPITIVP